ncbi:hypothetical protein [Pseudoduganella sp. GCM10020061]|uniref:hypothetical protein n=1 Tax=Pseudoduganella sp. GCM10020061 TaxID=3317345 RepID=UPI00362F068E
MALFTTDLRGELDQVKDLVGEIVDEQLSPMISDAIQLAGRQFSASVRDASEQLQSNVKLISDELHQQRSVTKEDITSLIDYAALKIAATVDERLRVARREASELVIEKIERFKVELEDAAVRSRKTLYLNVCISIAAAMTMAAIGIIYRKINLHELDVFSVFRVVLLSTGAGTGLFALLKIFASWRGQNANKKNATTVMLSYVGALRPNGAAGLLCLSALLATGWALLTFYFP